MLRLIGDEQRETVGVRGDEQRDIVGLRSEKEIVFRRSRSEREPDVVNGRIVSRSVRGWDTEDIKKDFFHSQGGTDNTSYPPCWVNRNVP